MESEHACEASCDGFDGFWVVSLDVGRYCCDEACHSEVVCRGGGCEVCDEACGAFVVCELYAVAVEGLHEAGVGEGAEYSWFACVRHESGDASDEVNHFDGEFVAESEDAFGEAPPVEVGLFSEEEDEVVFLAREEVVCGEFEVFDSGVLDFRVGSEESGKLHGAREVVDVESFVVDGCEFSGVEGFDESFDGSGGDFAAVHPAGKAEEHSWGLERGLFENVQIVVFH